jgi:arylsulfatase A-like enzyme
MSRRSSLRLDRRWLPLALVVSLGACSRSGPETALEPVYRLEQALVGAGDRTQSCRVGNEVRPSIGCTRAVPLRSERRTLEADRRIALSLVLPVRAARPRPLLVEVRIWRPQSPEKIEHQVVSVRRGQPKLEVELETKIGTPGEELVVSAFAYEVPSQGKRWATRGVTIGDHAVLDVGLALHEVGVRAGASPAEFRLIARTEAGDETALLRRTVTPAESSAWVDERIDLSPLAGQRVQFVFESVARPELGSDPLRAFTIAVWGAPRVLEPRRVDGRYNLVLISLDTLRGDFVGSEVNGSPLTPRLDALAAAGASFQDVVTTYPSTAAAHMSLFTSTYPSIHGVTFPTHILPDSIQTLPEVLAAHGFTTAAVTEGGMLSPGSGFLRGFDVYREYSGGEVWHSERQVEKTFASGLEWVERNRDQRFFLFLHTYQVHNPYTPPESYRIVSGSDGKPTQQDNTPRAFYKGEIRYTDATVGDLVERLGQIGVLDSAILVITSDHGEELHEHGWVGHAMNVYEPAMRIPLILWGPSVVPEGRSISDPASLLDVAPTLLDLLRLPPVAGLQGQSLVPALEGKGLAATRVRYAEGPERGKKPSRSGPLVMAREGNHKWIAHKGAPERTEIYDLRSDPGERHPLDDAALRERGEQLFREFDALVESAARHPKPPERALDEETAGKLRALGYID